MTTSITILKTVKPPLRWVPEPKDFTTEFLESKSRDPNGPSLDDLMKGPNSVLREAQRILGRCLPPTELAGSETGLVVGYVQSGKTMSFETVISLARDNGYGLVIVLAGTKNNLRDQSEDRLKKDLGIDDGGDHWYHLSNPAKAKRTQIESKVAAWRRKSSKKSLLITVLKHGGHLEKLAAVLQLVSLDKVPALIIDDESDQASLNTQAARVRNGLAAVNAMSATYERILDLRAVLPHHSYLQYTATPQANLLLAQTDLLNASFAELVTPGDAYTGGHSFFKGAAGLIEEIPAAQVPTLRAPLTGPPKTLLKALRYFLLVAAHHSLTRKKGLTSKDRNRSMMVHPAVTTASHRVYKNWVDKALKGLKSFIQTEHETKPDDVAARFAVEYDLLMQTYPAIRPLSELVTVMAEDVLDDLNCVEVNGTPDAEKKVNWKGTRYWILVGGAKLDRGYTVEGLCVTYMPRPLGTSPAADTLQQRARFFGYKKAYLGLCRVFVQQTIRAAFTEYVEHEDFVRSALEENRGKPLREWRRDFILTQLLKPTRPNVVGLATRRIPVDGWLVLSVLQRDSGAVLANRALLDAVHQKWRAAYGPVVNASVFPHLAPAKGPSPNDVIEGVPLPAVLGDFLLQIQVKDPRDAEEHNATLVALGSLLSKDDSLKVDVFLMNGLTPGYRSRDEGRGVAASHPFAPINQYFSQSAGSVNDKSFCSGDRISLQLRRFDLGHIVRNSSQADIVNVTWFALHFPSRLKKALVVERRG